MLHVLQILLILCLWPAIAAGHSPDALGSVRLEWSTPHVSRVESLATYTRGPILLGTKAEPAHVEERAGLRCAVGGLLAVDIADDHAFDIDEEVTLELTLDTTSAASVIVLYDHALVSGAIAEAREVADKNRFRKIQIVLPRARLANRLRLHADLVIAAPGSVFADPEGRWTALSAQREVAVCGLELRRSHSSDYRLGASGTLQLTVLDENNGPTAARVGLYDAAGRMPLPGGQALPIRLFDREYRSMALIEGWETWPTSRREVFYIDGSYRAVVPAGDYELIISKGPEYRRLHRTFHVGAGSNTELELRFNRWTDMPAAGWRSGDGHVHITRKRVADRELLSLLSAEDLHITNLLQMGTLTNAYFHQPAFGPAGRYSSGPYWLLPGEETPRTSDLGHHAGLNIREYHHFPEYHRIDRFAEAVAREGGLFGYLHVGLEFGGIDRSLALGVPLNIGTFAEVLQAGSLNTRLLDDFLNMGFKLVPISGTDFPYLSLPGTERTYVRTGQDADPDAWFEGLAAGRAFVTNGPLLEIDVAGAGPGDTISAGDEAVEVVAHARLNPDLGQLERVELMAHGRVIATEFAQGNAESITLRYSWKPDSSAWVTVRTFGSENAMALTAPVYVTVEGNQWYGNLEALPCLVERYRTKLQEIRDLVPSREFDPERWDYSAEELAARWMRQRDGILELVDRADAVYVELVQRTNSTHCNIEVNASH